MTGSEPPERAAAAAWLERCRDMLERFEARVFREWGGARGRQSAGIRGVRERRSLSLRRASPALTTEFSG